jgi:Flp pilus assembly pilin Flp
MLRNFLKNRKAQNTAEYALLIALVVAGVIAMQTYAQRALQARVHDASTYMEGQSSSIGNSTQYEPYYLVSNYDSDTSSVSHQRLGTGLVAADSQSNVLRSGGQTTSWATNEESSQTQ